MFSKCIILFLATIPLIILFDGFSNYINSYRFKKLPISEKKWILFIERVVGFAFGVCVLVFFLSIIFGTYIYIFY